MREAKAERTAQLLDHPKKGEMASQAERLLKGSGWTRRGAHPEPGLGTGLSVSAVATVFYGGWLSPRPHEWHATAAWP